MSSPFTDDEMIKGEKNRPQKLTPESVTRHPQVMQERDNPAVTRNGGGQHISSDDDGWVVPLDELSKAELDLPEVENTRF